MLQTILIVMIAMIGEGKILLKKFMTKIKIFIQNMEK